MSFMSDDDAPIVWGSEELKERGPNGQRVIQMGLTVYNSTSCQEFGIQTGRWEGGKTYQISWEQMLELHASIGRNIEILKPIIESGKLLTK